MYHSSANALKAIYPDYPALSFFELRDDTITCDWPSLRAQLLLQWSRLTVRDLDVTGRSRRGIALLVQRKYGVSATLVENYLSNLERTLPVLSA